MASSEYSVSALIDHEHSGSSPIVDTNIVQLVTATLPNPKLCSSSRAAAPGSDAEKYIGMFARTTLAVLCSIVIAECLTLSTFAVEVTQPAGAAHGYPGLYDINGKKLANAEFKQWLEDGHLYVVITYRFSGGQFFEEKARFRQGKDLIQEEWSWKELSHGRPEREFSVDFGSGTATAHIRKDNKDVSEKIDIEPGRTFAGFGFTIAISNLRKRLVKGEHAQLKAVGFSPFPTLKPQVVTVTISHGGVQRMKMGGRLLKGDEFIIHPEVPLIAKLFLKVPDTKIWLTNPPPAGFLRWEGPTVLPTDPMIRVDLISSANNAPAEPERG